MREDLFTHVFSTEFQGYFTNRPQTSDFLFQIQYRVHVHMWTWFSTKPRIQSKYPQLLNILEIGREIPPLLVLRGIPHPVSCLIPSQSPALTEHLISRLIPQFLSDTYLVDWQITFSVSVCHMSALLSNPPAVFSRWNIRICVYAKMYYVIVLCKMCFPNCL